MSSVWEFVKRHRGKLLLGGVTAGGVYLVHQAIERAQLRQEEARASALPLGGVDVDALQLQVPFTSSISLHVACQARRHYIFDSNQRTCDNSILELLPSIAARMQMRFDVESVTESLKRDSHTLTQDEKIAAWQKIKVRLLR